MKSPRPRHRSRGVGAAIFWHFARRLLPWVLVLAVYAIGATLFVRWDVARNGGTPGDFGTDLYGMYTQLFFEPTAAFPAPWMSRIVFCITPLLGALLFARGLLRVGTSVFDPIARRRLWVKIMSDKMENHVIVCGLGHVGGRVVESLRALNEPVIAIERREEDSSFGQAMEASNVPIIYGDVRRDELLLEAGIRRAKTVVCATDDDLTNLEVAIDARRENPGIRVVIRIFDQRMAEKIGAALSLDETFSTSALAGPLVALQATEAGVRGAYRLKDGTLRADMEVPAPRSWWGRAVAACEDEIDARLVGIQRGGSFVRARHDTKLAEGDVVTLNIAAENVAKLHTI